MRRIEPIQRDVSIERDGKPYSGTYTVARGIVTVSYGLDSKSTQVGGSSIEHIAKLLLAELVEEHHRGTTHA